MIDRDAKSAFVKSWEEIQEHVHNTAVKNGFWDNPEPNYAEKLMLIVTELGEACEALRHNNPPSDHIPEFSGVEEELADVIIRMMDMAQKLGYDIPRALLTKIEYNAMREYKHGKTF